MTEAKIDGLRRPNPCLQTPMSKNNNEFNAFKFIHGFEYTKLRSYPVNVKRVHQNNKSILNLYDHLKSIINLIYPKLGLGESIKNYVQIFIVHKEKYRLKEASTEFSKIGSVMDV